MTDVMVVSALYGGYDPPPRLQPLPGARSVMYTDDPHLDITGWDEVRYVNHGIATVHGDPRITGPMLAHKYWKMFAGAEESDITIWLDASMTVVVDDFVQRCVDAVAQYDMAFVRHPWRTCIYDEADYSASLPRYAALADDIRDQVKFYDETCHHPRHWGLFASGLYVRRNTELVGQVMRHWWWENITRTHQDQISLPVILRLAMDQGLIFDDSIPWHNNPGCWTHLGHHLK